MPALVLVAIVVLALLAAGIGLTFSLLGLVFTLFVAAVVGWLADRVVPGELPYGWLGATVVGLAGSWLGTLLLGPVGPVVAGVPVLPAFLGAVVLAFGVQWIAKRRMPRKPLV